MFTKQFHQKIRERRLARGLKQRAAAESCGITPSRWSDLERGRRRPNPQERARISKFLHISGGFIPPARAVRKLLDLGDSLKPCQPPYFCQQDRPTFVRFATLRKQFPHHADSLARLSNSRADSHICEQLSHQISCDSYLETLFLLYLQAAGAKPCLIAPSHLARLPHPIVSCDGTSSVDLRPRPCFVLQRNYYFFQVSFRLSATVRVDILKWKENWTVIELDGLGHDGQRDFLREVELGMPVVRFRRDELLQLVEDFLQKKAA